MYADDCAFWTIGKDLPELVRRAQQMLHKVETWSNEWGLEFDPTKTKAVIFTHCRKLGNPTIKLKNHEIEFTKKVKYLGSYM